MSTVIPHVSRLSSRIIRVLGCNASPMTLQGTNTYIVGSGVNRVLIDCSDRHLPQYVTHLKQVVEENHIRLTRIIITHWHSDHSGGAVDILDALKLTDCLVQKIVDSEHDSDDLKAKLTHLSDGESIGVEGATLKIVATPGHTEDHVVIVLEEENAVFSGDCILGEGTTVFEDLYTYMKSLKAILQLSPSVIYPGHGPVVTEPIAKISEYIAHREQREKQIMDALKQQNKPLSPLEIVKIVYKETPEYLYLAAANNVKHHLDKLIKENRVDSILDDKTNELKYFVKV